MRTPFMFYRFMTLQNSSNIVDDVRNQILHRVHHAVLLLSQIGCVPLRYVSLLGNATEVMGQLVLDKITEGVHMHFFFLSLQLLYSQSLEV